MMSPSAPGCASRSLSPPDAIERNSVLRKAKTYAPVSGPLITFSKVAEEAAYLIWNLIDDFVSARKIHSAAPSSCGCHPYLRRLGSEDVVGMFES